MMSDLTVQFDDLPLIHLAGMSAATIDGAADIAMRSSPHDWEVVAIRLNGWVSGAHKGAFVSLLPVDPWFFEIANAIGIDLALSEAIERGLKGVPGQPTAYDRARDLREVA
jgi:hypothetical protein